MGCLQRRQGTGWRSKHIEDLNMNIRTANLNEVLGFRAQRSLQFGHGADGVPFTDVTGFHIYADLGLHLRLAAAQDARNADKYLEILKEYAEIAEGCCARPA